MQCYLISIGLYQQIKLPSQIFPKLLLNILFNYLEIKNFNQNIKYPKWAF